MGGSGSTRWGYYRAKPLVEDARTLSLGRLLEEKVVVAGRSGSGKIEWKDQWGAPVASVRFKTKLGLEEGELLLSYAIVRDGEKRLWETRVDLETTSLPSGGRRWWFVCPASRMEPCRRRCTSLYLTKDSTLFRCRTCAGLVYTSSRESRKWDSMFGKLSRLMRVPPEDLKGLDREIRRL